MTSIFARPPRTRQILATLAAALDEREIKTEAQLQTSITDHIVAVNDTTRRAGVVARLAAPITLTQAIVLAVGAARFTLIGSPTCPLTVAANLADLFTIQATGITLAGVVVVPGAGFTLSRFLAASLRATDLRVEECDVTAQKFCFVNINCDGAQVSRNRLRDMSGGSPQISMAGNHHLVAGNEAYATMDCTVAGAQSRALGNDFRGGVTTCTNVAANA